MFISREALETGVGTAPLGLRIATSSARLGRTELPSGIPPFGQRLAQLRQHWELRLARLDWTPDLAEEIGSARWFRGLGTLFGLSALALAFLPDFSSIAAPPAMHVDSTSQDEFRNQAIQPLAYGGESGRKMGLTERVSPVANVPERPIVQLTATFTQGDSFDHLLERAGVGAGDATRVSNLVAGSIEQGGLTPGTQIDITLGKRSGPGLPRPLEAVSFRARFDLKLGVVRSGSDFVLRPQAIAVNAMPLRIRGTIGAGLYRSARAAGAPIEAIQQYLQVLDQHLSLDTAIEPGDTFDIIVGFKRAATGETRVGELLFAGVERNGRPKAQLLRWGGDGQFFEASGMGAQRSGLIMPVVGRITSDFGARRHPILGYTRMHAGVDFGAPMGAPIYAVGDATVTFAGWGGGHGNHVKLDHGGGWGTGYSHMSRIAVSPGSRVRAGQVIGYVGSTGLSTGPHLHYELYRNGAKVNPMSVRFTVSNQVDAKELAAFKARMAALKAVVPGAALGPAATPAPALPQL
ncbi:M23 family metallopeptidase [Novosphingobium ginsenosidimutans]|uniref:Peptidoglycan DD-metalloendopeptidase family protein n=1 Tax=Novosphingobium ginsenosidimutans TaxID=1176536 RepID=A0A5B8S2M4_9SPHN|nr:M23 family metallopeptidase [Novosphingobium ginsenosidimutans]QEA15776.1 peptidoglycan DD-metalloendopeptidase family protein [Novosphingobium ginsenosidimutans]